jgi:hypothetical protein
MLKVINLYVIDRIFMECDSKISPKAKMLYINCLTHHFKEKSPLVSNAVAFEMFEEDFGDFSRFGGARGCCARYLYFHTHTHTHTHESIHV